MWIHSASVSCHTCIVRVACEDKDWEDLRKMPEHPTLVKEFKKSRLVFLCLNDTDILENLTK